MVGYYRLMNSTGNAKDTDRGGDVLHLLSGEDVNGDEVDLCVSVLASLIR